MLDISRLSTSSTRMMLLIGYKAWLLRIGRPTSPTKGPPKGSRMQLGRTKRTNQFLASLIAEGKDIIEDVWLIANRSKSATPPPTYPVTLVVEEKVNVALIRDGGVSSFDVQGTLSLQVLEEKDFISMFRYTFLVLCAA